MNKNNLKLAGLFATVIGSAISIAAAIISDKRQELEIEEAVNKAVDKALEDRDPE